MLASLLVFLGGGAGALARFGAGGAWLRVVGPQHPWAGLRLTGGEVRLGPVSVGPSPRLAGSAA